MWDLDRSFETKAEFEKFMVEEDCWATRSSGALKNGHKTLYRCNKVTVGGPQCAAELYVLHQTIIIDANEPDAENVIGREAVVEENIVEENITEGNIAVIPNPDTEPNAIVPQANEQNPAAEIVAGVGKHIFKVYRLNRMHNHEELENQTPTKVKPYVQKLILELSKNFKPYTIIMKLRAMDEIKEEDQPNKRQVRAVIDNFKSEQYGKEPITMRQLTDFVEMNMEIPNELDKAFILSFERSPSRDPNKYFHYFVTTRRLLQMASMAKNLHADATHKVTSEKLPFIVMGSTDMTRRFHLIGYTVTSNETANAYKFAFNSIRLGVAKITGQVYNPTFMMSDGDAAIHKGLNDSDFDADIQTMMCYTHVMSNVERKYKFVTKANKPLMLADLRILHKSPNYRTFSAGCNLFVEKWIDYEREAVKKLENSFFKKNYNWFIGSAFRVPKTNNALERFNGTTKIFQTQYEQKPLKQFIYLLMTIAKERSTEYVMDKDGFQSELKIKNALMDKGFSYQKNFFYMENNETESENNETDIDSNETEKENKETEFFVFRGGIDKEITQEDVEAFQNAVYESFDEFTAKAFDIHQVVFPPDSAKWMDATCTCPAFDADYMCKHIIGIAHQIEILQKPDKDYDDEPIFGRAKKGRPKRASGALSMN